MFLKSICTIVLLSLYCSTTLFAEENITSQEALKKLIKEIKKVPASQKRVKMNELKILLRTMNQDTRKEVMLNLQKSFAKNRPQQSNIAHENEIIRQNNQNIARQPMRQGQGQSGHR